MRSIDKKKCKCGCGKPVIRIGNIKWGERTICEECGIALYGRERCVYKKKIYCQPCIRKLKRRGA